MTHEPIHRSRWQLPPNTELPEDWHTRNGRERGKLLREAVYRAYEAQAKQRRSQRIGASWIGKECTRAIWATFRWADKLEVFSGRMLRLFETGQQQETRLVQDLRRVGAAVFDRDPNDSRRQISVSSHNGHHFGYLDSVAQLVPFALFEWSTAVEMKSHNSKSFAKLDKEGVELAKPEHYAQLMTYMRESAPAKRGEPVEGLYAAVNKDTDELFFEFVMYDARYAERLAHKAGVVITSDKPPERIHRDPSFIKCRFCSAKEWCHAGVRPQRSCRTCMFSQPAADGKWECVERPEAVRELSIEAQHAGCGLHRFLPGMITNSEQTDVVNGAVIYKMSSGATWSDRGPDGDKADAEAGAA